MAIKRPLVLVDLDDTLFQTRRKMTVEPAAVAGLDKHGQPLSFMNPVQQEFVDWLFAHADLVPVTARSRDALNRVQLPFSGLAICNHGASLLTAERELDPDWHRHIQQQLEPLRPQLVRLLAQVQQLGAELEIPLRCWLAEEDGLPLYVLIKDADQQDARLIPLASRIQAQLLPAGFYLHRNSNNLALLPRCLNKRETVLELLRRSQQLDPSRPILGFGDSLSDFNFLDLCHWWATPQPGQLSQWLAARLREEGHFHG